MNWLRRFMMGRYGVDQLSIALLVLSLIFTSLAKLFRTPVLIYISYIPWGLSVFRILSRNIGKRSMENYRFSIVMSSVYAWFRKMRNRIERSKTQRSFKCPGCRTRLWVPKGKGKVIITCSKCKTEFRGRT